MSRIVNIPAPEQVLGSKPKGLDDIDLSKFISVEHKEVPRTSDAPQGAGNRPRVSMNIRQEALAEQTVEVSKTQAVPAEESSFASSPSFDASYQSEGLPSNFLFYPFKSLHSRTLVPRDQFAIYRGRQEGKISYAIEAISATIRQDAYDLTVGDFWYLMYQQRLKSFKKTPFSVGPWTCVSDKHLEMIQELEARIQEIVEPALPEDGSEPIPVAEEVIASLPALQEALQKLRDDQTQTTTVLKSDLQIVEIDEEREEKIRACLQRMKDDYDVDIVPVTMRSLVESMEERIKPEDLEFIQFQNRYAACLGPRHGKTLADKRKYLSNSPHNELLNDIDEFLSITDHGVNETFNCKCKGCGIVEKVAQTIDIPHFFPRLVG